MSDSGKPQPEVPSLTFLAEKESGYLVPRVSDCSACWWQECPEHGNDSMLREEEPVAEEGCNNCGAEIGQSHAPWCPSRPR